MKSSMAPSSLVVVVALIGALVGSGGWQQVARAQVVSESRLSSVQAFFAPRHLPVGTSWHKEAGALEAGLGHVSVLDIGHRPQSSYKMSTVFNIYHANGATHDVTFRPSTPLEKLEFIRGDPIAPKPALDYQYDLEKLARSGFDISKKTVIMTPGFMTHAEEPWTLAAKDLWLKLYGDDVNVIIVGWPHSNGLNYGESVANTVLVARQITIFLHYLAQLAGSNLRDQDFLDRIHLLGHSCGAHISGYVGKDLGGRVGRITGLDPAGPIYDTLPAGQRLDRADAQLVEALHTNAGHLVYAGTNIHSAVKNVLLPYLPGGDRAQKHELREDMRDGPSFGIRKNIGHIDYYTNDGHNQEGCDSDIFNVCDHGRSTEILIDVLKFELHLRESGHSDARAHFRHRLWAFRASDFRTFGSGVQLLESCPHLMDIESHLDPARVDQSIRQCAVPLLDVLTPVHKLIGELRDEFNINFEADASSEAQPNFFFRTQVNARDPTRMMGDHFLLKVYLDREHSQWDTARCTLGAELQMTDAQKVTVDMGKLTEEQTILAAPFAHPNGPEAHLELLELESLLGSDAADTAQERISALLVKLFPRMTTIKFVTLDPKTNRPTPGYSRVDFAPDCQVRIKAVEVHPVDMYASFSAGALYGAKSLAPGQEMEFVSVDEFAARLREMATRELLTPGNWYEATLESAILDRPTSRRARNLKRTAKRSVGDKPKPHWLGSLFTRLGRGE